LRPYPACRRATPSAAVVLPFPLPVLISTSPGFCLCAFGRSGLSGLFVTAIPRRDRGVVVPRQAVIKRLRCRADSTGTSPAPARVRRCGSRAQLGPAILPDRMSVIVACAMLEYGIGEGCPERAPSTGFGSPFDRFGADGGRNASDADGARGRA